MRYVVLYALAVTLYACGASPDARGGALEPKDRAGKLVGDADEPYDPEPDAGAALPDAGSGDARAELARDARVELPDAAQAPAADADVPKVDADAAQAPAADADVPKVDAGPPATLAGAWDVVVTAVGISCGGREPTSDVWTVDGAASTVATPQGTLSKMGEHYAGVLGGGLWAAELTVSFGGQGFMGTLTRQGVSCADRWTVMGVRP